MPPNTPQNSDQESSHHKKHPRLYQQSLKSKGFDPLATSFRKLFQGRTRSKPSSKLVTPQDSNADLRLYEEAEHSDTVLQSLPFTSRAIEKSISATLQDNDVSYYNASEKAINQPNVNSRGTESIDPEVQSDKTNTQVAKQAVVTMFQDAQHLNISGNAQFMNIGHQYVNSHGNSGFDTLEKFVSFNALHDSSAQDPERCCHPGTRENVLDQMRNWADDSSKPERILWLHGPAGVGKSAIAQTIAYSYDRDKVGATFFFFRSDPVRNDGNRLFPTLAWQLALSLPIVKDLIAFCLEEYPDLPRKTIEAQFKQLIARPFLTISGGKSKAPIPTRVIIIDGLDECSDVKLQRRILKIIGSAVSDPHFPLRFIISSRPEAHIEDFFAQFKHPTLQIDLSNVNEAYHDIETYLTSEFARIAVEQELDPEVWPGRTIIDTLVSKSSGQFIYASTVIRRVDDDCESAVAQLNVILGLKLSAGKSPFSELDRLYTEILHRQPDKNFLKEFLVIIVACSALSQGNLHEDYAMLLGLDEKELHRKLRGMHSLFKSKPFIDIHHKSFLDFLDDSSRSGEYHVSKNFANRRYMERITNLLVKAASRAIEQPLCHESDHFKPRFGTVINSSPFIELPLDDLVEILQPLQIIQENLLQLPNMTDPRKPTTCDECWTFYMIDGLLLHLAWFRGTTRLQEPKFVDIRPLTAMEEKQDIPQLDLDTCLSLLLTNLGRVEFSLNIETIGLMRALVRFNPTETAMKIRSIMDAQNLVELIFCLNKKQCFNSWFGVAAHNATRLAVAIYGRVPLLPRSLFLNSANFNRDEKTYEGKAVKIWDLSISFRRKCLDAFIWGSLCHDNMGPLMGICSYPSNITVFALPESSAVNEWRKSTNPSVSKIQQTFFEVAKAIQYIHSLDIMLGSDFHPIDVYLDSDNHVKVQCPSFCPNDLCKGQFNYDGYHDPIYALDDGIHSFGLILYEILFNEPYRKDRPMEPEIPDNVWQLIQWCAKDPEERPTIDQIVQEMESWISLGQFTLSP